MSLPETITCEDSPTVPNHAPPAARPIGCFRCCAVVVVVLITLFLGLSVLFYWWGHGDRRDHGGRWRRDANGNLVPVKDRDDPAWGLNVKAGATRISKSASSATSSSNSDRVPVLTKKVTILNHSGHPVMIALGAVLVEKLGGLPYVEQVEYIPCGQERKEGSALPDLFLTIDLADVQESHLAGRHLSGRFLFHFGSRPVKEPCHYFDSHSRPLAEVNSSQTTDLTADFTGVSTESAFYDEVARNAAEGMIKHLDDWVKKSREKAGPPPPIPAEFYPEYERPELPEALSEFKPQRRFAGNGFMLPGYGLWDFTTAKDPGQFIPKLCEALKSEGWKGSAEGKQTYLRMTRDEDVCYVFPAPKPDIHLGTTIWVPDNGGEEIEPASREYYVEVINRMSRDEVAALLDRYIAGKEASPQLLCLFEQFLSPEQSKRLLATLDKRSGKTAKDWLDVAKLLRKARVENADKRAREALEKAWTLSHFARNPGSLQEDIRAQAKSLKCEKEFKNRRFDLDAMQLEELGVVKLPTEDPLPRRTVGVDSQALFFAVGPEGKIAAAGITIHAPEPPQKPDMTRPAPFGLTFSTWRKGMSSRSTGTFYPQSNGGTEKQHLDIKGLGRYEFTISHLPPKNAKEKDQFEISVEFEPEPENAGSPALKDRPNTGCAGKRA